MRFFKADKVFPISSDPVENGILVTDDDGTIVGVQKPEDESYAIDRAEKLSGWLVPGFINAHCHLELSHLKGKVEEATGLDGFVESLMQLRQQDDSILQAAIKEADALMWKNGIVGVGDISNGSRSFAVKETSPIHYFTFIERFGLQSSKAKEVVASGLQIQKQLKSLKRNFEGNLSPHAPYSASTQLLKALAEVIPSNGIVSIHNQETASEDELFVSGEGKMAERLKRMGMAKSEFPQKAPSSLQAVFPQLPSKIPIQLVHNTFTTQADIDFLGNQLHRVYFCLCPRANKYIENRLPDIELFVREDVNLTIGTDSLASNAELSILAELITIQEAYPELKAEQLFKWATLNGARLFGWEKQLGSFEIGKRPGILNIQGVETFSGKISPQANICIC